MAYFKKETIFLWNFDVSLNQNYFDVYIKHRPSKCKKPSLSLRSSSACVGSQSGEHVPSFFIVIICSVSHEYGRLHELRTVFQNVIRT
jgi:hypothetical protein